MNYSKAFTTHLPNKALIEKMQIQNPFVKLNDIVFNILESAILQTLFTPGEKLNISKLADQLGVSPTPVREALDKLAEIGLVIVHHKKDRNYNSYYVIDPDEKMLEGLFTSRLAVEPSAAYICADKNWLVNTDKLYSIIDTFEKELRKGNFNELNYATEYDLAFHSEIIHSTHDNTLISMYSTVSKKLAYLSLRTKEYLAYENKDALYRLGRQHKSICHAIEMGFPKLASELMIEHIKYCESACLSKKTNYLKNL